MAKPFDAETIWRAQRDRIIGLGERSVHKNYYPLLRRNLTDLKKLLQAVEQATIGILICNRDVAIEYVNPALCGITGFRAEELIGRTPRACWSGAAAEQPWDDLERAVAQGAPWQGEMLFRRKSGDDFWNSVSVTPVRDDTGAITHAIAINEDISERKQAEMQIHLAAQVFAASGEGIVIANAQRKIVDVNAAFEAMTGYRRDELVGRPISELRSDSHDPLFYENVWADVTATGQWKGEVWRRRKNREVFLAQMAINGIRSEAGTVTHYVGTFSDITDRWKAAEQLREAKEDLERRVEERTRELKAINRQLAAAKSNAEQANLSKTRFLAAASHDLLQPLNAARIFGSLLAARRLAPANRDLLRNTLTALDTVDEILTALLDISKLDAGGLPVSVTDFAVANLFLGLGEQCRLLAGRKGLDLTFVPSSLWVRSDPRLLGRILHNHIANAIRYTPEGGRVLVGCRRRGGQLLLGVWDTGQGVPKDKLEEIFEEFHRLDGEVERREKGMGLGLAIVRRIARLLGHRSVVRSTLGKGSLFGVEVPLVAGRRPDPEAVAVRAQPRTALSILRGAQIVIIDDDASILAGMRKLIEHWGCRAVAGASGASVFVQLPADGPAPHLIVADYHLQPGEMGLSVIAGLRERFHADIPAIVVTADHSERTQLMVRRAGCHFLAKPIRPPKLGSLMAQMLRDRER